LAPYIATWEITGGWVISGDLPTDYVLDETILSVRESLRFVAEYMLGGLLQSRAGTLMDFANDGNLWPDEPENTQEAAE
jgi:hypothetical protein